MSPLTNEPKPELQPAIAKAIEDNPDLSPQFIEEALAVKKEIESGNVEPYAFGEPRRHRIS